jgi:hypothetical protein
MVADHGVREHAVILDRELELPVFAPIVRVPRRRIFTGEFDQIRT